MKNKSVIDLFAEMSDYGVTKCEITNDAYDRLIKELEPYLIGRCGSRKQTGKNFLCGVEIIIK
jgi:hypothetical protein